MATLGLGGLHGRPVAAENGAGFSAGRGGCQDLIAAAKILRFPMKISEVTFNFLSFSLGQLLGIFFARFGFATNFPQNTFLKFLLNYSQIFFIYLTVTAAFL